MIMAMWVKHDMMPRRVRSPARGMMYVRQVPYTPSEGDPLDEFAYNDEVVAIRDEYKADLVQLVGDVHDVCGEA